MRASHADREQVIDTLKAAFVYGLVTKGEFDERVSQTLTSRTRDALAIITADIPAGLAAAPATLSPAPARSHTPVHVDSKSRERAVVATAAIAGLALIAAFLIGNAVAGLLALGAAGSALLSLSLVAAQILSSRRDKNPGGQLPPQAAVSTGHSAGQLPRGSRASRQRQADTARLASLRTRLST
jgi:hypothetical protein